MDIIVVAQVTVGGGVVTPASVSKPDVRLSTHPAPESTGCCVSGSPINSRCQEAQIRGSGFQNCKLRREWRHVLRLHIVAQQGVPADAQIARAAELGR